MLACEQAIFSATEAEPLQGQARKKQKLYEQLMNKRYETSRTLKLKSYAVCFSKVNENLNYFGILTIFVA